LWECPLPLNGSHNCIKLKKLLLPKGTCSKKKMLISYLKAAVVMDSGEVIVQLSVSHSNSFRILSHQGQLSEESKLNRRRMVFQKIRNKSVLANRVSYNEVAKHYPQKQLSRFFLSSVAIEQLQDRNIMGDQWINTLDGRYPFVAVDVNSFVNCWDPFKIRKMWIEINLVNPDFECDSFLLEPIAEVERNNQDEIEGNHKKEELEGHYQKEEMETHYQKEEMEKQKEGDLPSDWEIYQWTEQILDEIPEERTDLMEHKTEYDKLYEASRC